MTRVDTGNNMRDSGHRIYLYDNAKFILIFLVVLGHLTEYFLDDSSIMKSTFIFIYSFHMPLFIFLSGLFQKKYSDTVKLNKDRVMGFILLGFVYKFVAELYNAVGRGSLTFSLFYERKIPWYLFALAAYMVFMYLLRNFNPGFILVFTIALACFAGYDSNVTHFLCLGRIITFFPFYVAGYYLEPDTLAEFLKKKWIKAAAVIVLAAAVYICLTRIDGVYYLRSSFTAVKGYDEWTLEHGGALVRLLCYGISTVMGLAVMAIVPNVNAGYITYCGSRTLQVFFWHKIIVVLVSYTGFWNLLFSFGIPGKLSFVVISLVLVMVLSLKAFQYPTDYILKKSFIKKK